MRKVVVSCVVMLAVAAGCGRSTGGTAGARLKVVASFYPLFEAAERVGSDRVAVSNLTPAGTEPHDLELNSRQVDRIEGASVVLFLGRGFQPAVQKAVDRSKATKVDLLAQVSSLLPAPQGDEKLDADPHVWLDPALFKAMVGRVADALSAADKANEATYRANAEAYQREIDDLDSSYAAGLASCDRKAIVTSHAAFGYLARHYGLTQEPIAGLDPEAEPSPRRLADLSAQVRADGTTTIFYETLVSPKVAEALAREAGVATAVLDPLEGLSDKELKAGKTYVSVMRDNLAALRKALGCH